MIHFSACLGCDFRAVIFECFIFFGEIGEEGFVFFKREKT
jgi:hypothetical protein